MRFRATENSHAMSIKIDLRGVNDSDPPLSVVWHEIRRIAGRFDRRALLRALSMTKQGLAPVPKLLPQCVKFPEAGFSWPIQVSCDDVEGVDGDVEPLRILVQFLITASEGHLSTEQVDGHALIQTQRASLGVPT
jgi:hypothetical protein